MPLRDHFRAPLDNRHSWEGFQCQWPGMMLMALAKRLPQRYFLTPRLRSGLPLDADEVSFDPEDADTPAVEIHEGTAIVNWTPELPTQSLPTDWLIPDEFEVRVHDFERGRRLVAVV